MQVLGYKNKLVFTEFFQPHDDHGLNTGKEFARHAIDLACRQSPHISSMKNRPPLSTRAKVPCGSPAFSAELVRLVFRCRIRWRTSLDLGSHSEFPPMWELAGRDSAHKPALRESMRSPRQ